MLEIIEVKWRNFQSYGDYETVIRDLDKLGPTLISGSIDDGDSNGAGKSTIPTAILWCLTGRTFSKAKPGDSVANFYNELECYVEVKAKDGWTIKRTRRSGGSADLLVYDGSGEDESRSTNEAAQKFINTRYNLDYELLVSSMFFGQMSKSFLEASDTVRKSILERLLGIDRINAWAEAAKVRLKDVESKQETIRAAIGTLNSNIEKHKKFIADNEVKASEYEVKIKRENDQLIKDIANCTEKVASWELVKEKYAKYKQQYEKIDAVKEALENLKTELTDLELKASRKIGLRENCEANITSLKARLKKSREIDTESALSEINKYKEQLESLSILKAELTKLEKTQSRLEVDIKHNKDVITKFAEMSGTKCPTCQQDINDDHANDLCSPYQAKIEDLESKATGIEESIKEKKNEIEAIDLVEPSMSENEIKRAVKDRDSLAAEIKTSEEQLENYDAEVVGLSADIETRKAKIEKISKGLKDNAPAVSLVEVITAIQDAANDESTLKRLLKSKEDKVVKANPFRQVINNYNDSISNDEQEIKDKEADLAGLSEQASHYQYLQKSYSDRSKIKRLILSKMVPMLNERVKYYLECFKCDITFAFKDNLSIESSLWGYENCSGGERKRIDLSVMFALHDLYLGIYGRQCNVMVLDEVDGRLDTTGIESLIDIINNDFAGEKTERSKPGTIFVISHRSEMEEAFPSKIYVKRGKDRLSQIEEIK